VLPGDGAPRIIIIFMSIELILNAVNINLVAFSSQLQNAIGHSRFS
jgi:NADH:ubiquinone oxidoreductase subunit K